MNGRISSKNLNSAADAFDHCTVLNQSVYSVPHNGSAKNFLKKEFFKNFLKKNF